MNERVLSSRMISRRLLCATMYPSDDGAVVWFYVCRDVLLTRNGTCTIQRDVAVGQFELNGDEFRPEKPRRLYEVRVEGADLGGERDEL